MSRTNLLTAALAVACLSPAAEAAKVKVWQHSTQGHFDKAQLKGATVGSEGALRLARKLTPLTGLDAGSARQVKTVLRQRVTAGDTIIMTTHILEVAERMADRIGVIAHGKLIAKGKLGTAVSVEQGAAAARGCGINLLAQVKAAVGDLDKVVRVVRLGGFVNSAPDFLDGPKVLNGASDLMVAAFGDRGRHARTTVGVASLPAEAAVEVEATFEVG